MRSLILVFTFSAILYQVSTQKCSKSVSNPYLKQTHKWVGREATCHYKCFLKHRKQVHTGYSDVDNCWVEHRTSTESICCEGYKPNEGGDCEPVCEGCVNGSCTAPAVCTCNAGFRKEAGICVPVCDPECGRGTCEAPGRCFCHAGFGMDPRKGCVPSCNPPCKNGKCIDRNTCQCFRGYQPTDESNVCIPVCEPQFADCGNGTCTAPNSCSCEQGFVFENNRCIPECDPPCSNGNCTGPNTCTCKDEGFTNDPSNPNICTAICDPACQNGTCIAPNTCACLPGYHQSHTEVNKCVPSCDSEFVDITNGKCIAPNVLQCNEDFVLEYSELSGKTHCKYLCDPECVNGICGPNGTCQCKDGFTPMDDLPYVCQLESKLGIGTCY